MAFAVNTWAAIAAFASQVPRPQTLPPSTVPPKGSNCQSSGLSTSTTSMWVPNIKTGLFSAPSIIATTVGSGIFEAHLFDFFLWGADEFGPHAGGFELLLHPSPRQLRTRQGENAGYAYEVAE